MCYHPRFDQLLTHPRVRTPPIHPRRTNFFRKAVYQLGSREARYEVRATTARVTGRGEEARESVRQADTPFRRRRHSHQNCGSTDRNLIPARIGQASEPTSPSRPPAPRRRIREPGGSRPSPPRPTDHDRPSRSFAGRRRDGLVFAVARRSTADVPGCAGDGRGCGLAGNCRLRHKKGGQSSRQRTSIHVQAYVVRIRAELAPQQNRVRTRFWH